MAVNSAAATPATGTKRKLPAEAAGPGIGVEKASVTRRAAGRDITAAAIPVDMEPQLARIVASNRTVFEKRVWLLLCQIPPGRFTTYGLMSAHLGSSPRAVGNALRRNPFAPEVPCHRVVATGGNLGGFKGAWPKDGEGITIDEKRGLLRKEGIRFDGKGKVLGVPWAGFK